MTGIEELARELECEVSSLAELSAGAARSYREFRLRTGSGKKRRIHAPEPTLKHLQRQVLAHLLYRAPVGDCVHGFVPGRSIVTNARPHVGRPWVISLDIRDFFPSTTESLVKVGLQAVPGISDAAREALIPLLIFRGALPQGAPTSPCVANLAVRGLDERLLKLAAERGLTYTRYADDLTFSGEDRSPGLVAAVAVALEEFGYRLARHKTRRMGRHVRQEVTGLVVNEKVQPPREFRRWLRAVLFDVRSIGLEHALCRAGLTGAGELAGHLAFLAMTAPEQAEREVRLLLETMNGAGGDHSLRPEAPVQSGYAPRTVITGAEGNV